MLTFDNITQTDVAEAQEFLVAALRAAYPRMDLRSGTVFREQLLRPQAEIYAAERARYRELAEVRSLQAMAESGKAYDTAQIDAAAAPFGIGRRTGTAAHGVLRVIVSEDIVYVMQPESTVFSSLRDAAVAFRPSRTFVVSSAPESGQLRLYRINDGAWFFLLPVVAAATGPSGRLDAGEEVSGSFGGVVQVTAANEFAGGEPDETIPELITRLPDAVARRTLDSRTSIAGLLRDLFPEVRAVSVQGYGDPAQFRDRDNALGIAASGMVDVYAKDFASPVILPVRLAGRRSGSGNYVIDVGAGVAPGFMRVLSVSTATDGSAAPGSYLFDVVRGTEVSGPEPRPYLPRDPWIGAMTVYQTARIVVRDAGELGDAPEFGIEFMVSPGLPAFHALATDPAHRNMSADILARAPHVCLVHMRCPVRVAPGQGELSARDIQDALLRLVNGKGFPTRLTLSEVMAELHSFPIDRVDTGDGGFAMHGALLARGDRPVRTPDNIVDIDAMGLLADGITGSTTVFAATRATITVELRDV